MVFIESGVKPSDLSVGSVKNRSRIRGNLKEKEKKRKENARFGASMLREPAQIPLRRLRKPQERFKSFRRAKTRLKFKAGKSRFRRDIFMEYKNIKEEAEYETDDILV